MNNKYNNVMYRCKWYKIQVMKTQKIMNNQ